MCFADYYFVYFFYLSCMNTRSFVFITLFYIKINNYKKFKSF